VIVIWSNGALVPVTEYVYCLGPAGAGGGAGAGGAGGGAGAGAGAAAEARGLTRLDSEADLTAAAPVDRHPDVVRSGRDGKLPRRSVPHPSRLGAVYEDPVVPDPVPPQVGVALDFDVGLAVHRPSVSASGGSAIGICAPSEV